MGMTLHATHVIPPMKQVIVVRDDLDIGIGKLAAQVAHAAIKAADAADPDDRRRWKADGQAKVVLRAADQAELESLKADADALGLPTAIIRDAGRTQLDPGTVTTLGIGPGPGDTIDQVTGELSLL